MVLPSCKRFCAMQFAATAATIVSGAVAERCKFEGYLAYAALLTGWVYPVVVHCVLPSNAWRHDLSFWLRLYMRPSYVLHAGLA